MKGKQTSVYIKWSRFENDWRIGFLEFIFWLLRFTRGGGSGGDTKGGIQSSGITARNTNGLKLLNMMKVESCRKMQILRSNESWHSFYEEIDTAT
jgi:hypothetical protein